MRGVNNSVDTVNAAANAIISAETRVQQVTVPRRRWGACFSFYGCFGSQRQAKRINRALLVPEPTSTRTDVPASENPSHPSPITLPFIAPPSSPASFLNSEPPSSTQSPGGFMSLSLSANAYSSPSGPSSIFAIGPYANETQLVSPPVFSTFTTEPSTAPFTPPPESVQLTTPSSPEVPFARLLSSYDSNCKKGEAYEFQTYQFYPGSPIGHLISPSSVCSGTSSPFPDPEFYSSGGPPKIPTAEGLAERKLIPRGSSRRHGSILDGQITAVVTAADEPAINHRVSFELTAEEVTRCMEKKPAMPGEATLDSSFSDTEVMAKRHLLMDRAQSSRVVDDDDDDETSQEAPEKIESSGELTASREFKFNNSDGVAEDHAVGSEWWVNEKVISAEAMPAKKWAFFPMVQPGVS